MSDPSSKAQGLSEDDQHRLVMALARRRRRGRTGGPMSGGSFNYLCHSWDVTDLVEKRSNLEPMADELLRYGGEDAAKETLALLFDLRAFEVRVEAHIERLRKVWKAVEWTTDCDWGADSIAEALAEYRGLSGEDR